MVQYSDNCCIAEIAELSTDIHVITAEINAYQRVAGEAIFEIGRRLHEVKYNPAKYGLPSGTDKEGRTIVARGAWGEWLSSVGITDSVARRFIIVHTELGDSNRATSHDKLGMQALYEIAQLSPEQRTQPQTVPSTGEIKTVDEMTVRMVTRGNNRDRDANTTPESEIADVGEFDCANGRKTFYVERNE